ncbi:UNVERIFIED_CONTAM: mcpQ [Trichonephila clavipes]
MIGNLQGGTRDAVEFMRESSENANQCVQLAQEAGESLEAITAAVALMRDSNTQIAVAAAQQSQVAEEMSRSVVGIRDVTEQTVGQTLESAATSQQLATLAAQLNQAIRQLKL